MNCSSAYFQAKLLGEAWKSIDAEEKGKFERMADEDKARYKSEMENYEPPAWAAAGIAKKGKKKDKNAPKRAMTSFLCFSNEMRPKLKKEHPDMTFAELGRQLGALFRELTPEGKEKYEQMANRDKDRYKQQMADYKAKEDEAAAEDTDEDDDAADEKVKENDADSDDDDSDSGSGGDSEDDDSD